jgi:hypothetical protein
MYIRNSVVALVFVLVACTDTHSEGRHASGGSHPDSGSRDGGNIDPQLDAGSSVTLSDAAAAAEGGTTGAASHHDAGTRDAGKVDPQLDAGPITMHPDAGSAADGDDSGCRDDRPPADAGFVEGGSSCSLPDGGPGRGQGSYGCVDTTVCHCKPEAGPVECHSGTCVYAACSGVNEADYCTLATGERGRCCAGTCRNFDFFSDHADNCGGCGNACAEGQTCQGGNCGDCTALGLCACDGVQCPSGRTCVHATCAGLESPIGGCRACVLSECAGKPEGTACAFVEASISVSGMCCDGHCIEAQTDDNNCGGCRIQCCPGSHCMPGIGWFPSAACL